jgi:hypothetical protein
MMTLVVGNDLASIGRGIRRTISISNTMKIKASRKKRKENGIRAVFLGSNPHSNGDDFSRSVVDRVARIQAATKTRVTRVVAMAINRIEAVINWEYIIFFLIKSQVLNLIQAPQLDTGRIP